MYTQMGGWCLTTGGAKVLVYTLECVWIRGHDLYSYYFCQGKKENPLETHTQLLPPSLSPLDYKKRGCTTKREVFLQGRRKRFSDWLVKYQMVFILLLCNRFV